MSFKYSYRSRHCIDIKACSFFLLMIVPFMIFCIFGGGHTLIKVLYVVSAVIFVAVMILADHIPCRVHAGSGAVEFRVFFRRIVIDYSTIRSIKVTHEDKIGHRGRTLTPYHYCEECIVFRRDNGDITLLRTAGSDMYLKASDSESRERILNGEGFSQLKKYIDLQRKG